MKWQDAYNWKKGQTFWVPSNPLKNGGKLYKVIKDDDGIFLKDHGGAKDFDMKSNFSLEFNGTYDPKSKKWTSIKWK